jgi:four helix bundle protein
MQTHKNLKVWQRSISFVTEIYRVICDFPREEMYCMVGQLRRAAISIPSNIAEGSARRNTREYIQFLYVSLGSAAEIETQITISINLGYLMQEKSRGIQAELEEIIRMLAGLIKSLSDKITDKP